MTDLRRPRREPTPELLSPHPQAPPELHPPLSDLDRLYLDFAPSLRRIVGGGIRAPEVVVEDACQAAWARLVAHRHRITDDAARGWLTKTAVYEAYKLRRREVREAPVPPDDEHPPLRLLHGGDLDPQLLLERREQLESVGRLPGRQQRLMWLRALGASREEMARHERCTHRTVRRQLGRARQTLLAIDGGEDRARAA